MSASVVLIRSFIKHVRFAALPRPLHIVAQRDHRIDDEQRELEIWLFDRDSRWK